VKANDKKTGGSSLFVLCPLLFVRLAELEPVIVSVFAKCSIGKPAVRVSWPSEEAAAPVMAVAASFCMAIR
jgi:hypothetical protein